MKLSILLIPALLLAQAPDQSKPYVYTLTLSERIQMASVLPAEGSVVTLRIRRDLQAELSPTEEEIMAMDIKQDAGMIRWNEKGNHATKLVTIGPEAMSIVTKALKKLSDSGKLPAAFLPLYERFVPEKEPVTK